MGRSFRQSMAWLHTWAGLICGWLLFAVFVTGTASYYRSDITQWMRPELFPTTEIKRGDAARLAVEALQDSAPGARQWFVRLPGHEDSSIGLQWRTKAGARERLILDPATNAPVRVRETLGGEFLYRFHYELHMPPLWGRWIVGLATTIMLVALVSGVVTHRRIFKDFFTFRPAKGRRAWIDAHNVAGVLALPYHFMIAYSGLVLLSLTLMPWGVIAAYRGDASRFAAELGITALDPRPPSGRTSALAPVGPLLEQAEARMGAASEHLVIERPNDANATITFLMAQPRGLAHRHPQIVYDGVTGTILAESPPVRKAAETYFTLRGLHEAEFATPVLRVLYTLCGLLGAAMIATGSVLWVRARLPAAGKSLPFGLWLVRVLNISVIVGLPAAIAVYFLANRILPLGLADRASLEVQAFFGAWLAITLVALVLKNGTAWPMSIITTAALYLAIPITDLATVHRLEANFLIFDCTMMGLSLCFAMTAYQRSRDSQRGSSQ